MHVELVHEQGEWPPTEPLAEALQKLDEDLCVHSTLANHIQLQARLLSHSYYHTSVACIDIFLGHCMGSVFRTVGGCLKS